MFFAEFAKKSIYVATRSVNADGVSIYATPVKYLVSCNNVLPTSASADLVEVGTSFFDYLCVVGDPEYLSAIKELDKVYVDSTIPQTTDQLAKTADYVVKAKIVFPQCTKLILRRISTVNKNG